MVVDYYKKRKNFFDKYPDFFSDFPEQGLEYALYGSLKLSKEKVDEIKYASEEVWKVLRKVKNYVLHLEDWEIEELGYPKKLIPYMKLDYLTFDTVLSRFDFIVKENEIKAIELNNVTPFLVYETFFMNNEIVKNENEENENSEAQRVVSANENSEIEISKSYSKGISDCVDYLENENPKIGIVGQGIFDDWEEFVHVDFIKNVISENEKEIEFIDIKDLRIEIGKGVYNLKNEKIDILIMPAYPHEFLMNDVDDKGNEIGLALLDLVKQRELALLNPPSANILQSKITFAMLWNLYEQGELTPHEEEIVSKYISPTYDTPLPFYLDGIGYVKKSTIGREGSSVEIVRENSRVKSKFDAYCDYCSIYQEFFELPKKEVIINGELQEKHYIIGSFICNDKAVGLSCRLGNEITEWDSHWLAVAYTE